jgi:hypothetical protein
MPAAGDAPMPTIEDLDEFSTLLDRSRGRDDLYVRWSQGPAADLAEDESGQSSRDALTGIRLPGLSANPLRVEPWWDDRSIRLWVARRLYDYRHLGDDRDATVRPWVLSGEQCGRGPDNEPLVICRQPIAWVSDKTLRQCEELMRQQPTNGWGPLNRADGPHAAATRRSSR